MDDIINATGRKQNKAITLNYDDLSYTPNDRCLYCLADNEVRLLLALLEYVGWTKRWYSPTGAAIDQSVLFDLKAGLMYELMTDHCDLDTAITNIQNSLITINNDIVTINTNIVTINNNVTNIDIEVKNVITQNTNINIVNVINTYVSFSANLGDNSATDTYARYNALCAGLNDWVYSQCYRVASAAGVTAFGLDLIIAGLTVGVNILEGLIHSDNPGAYSATDLENAFTSTTDMDAVTCHMVTYLSNLPMTFDNFKNSLTTFTPANAYQTTIAITLQAALTYYDAFTAFVMGQQSEFQIALAANPTDFSCLSCTPLSFCSIPQTWDFRLLNEVPWVVSRGALSAGEGIKGFQIAGDLQFGWYVAIYFPTPCTALATHHIHFFAAQQSPGGNAYTVEFYYLLAGVPTRYNQSNLSSVSVWPTVDDITVNVPTPPGGVGVGIYRINIYTNTAYYGNATSHPSAASLLQKITFVT